MNLHTGNSHRHPEDLSPAALSVWAKSDWPPATGEGENWLPLWRHLDDTMGVAAKLYDEFLPQSITRRLAKEFGSEAAARAVTLFLAGSHDVGKASPAFAMLVTHLADRMRPHGLLADYSFQGSEPRRHVRHELVGMIALEEWLQEQHGIASNTARTLALPVGGHHGIHPDLEQLSYTKNQPLLFGVGLWADVREEFFLRAARLSGVDAFLGNWSALTLTPSTQVLLTAIVIIADWIASNTDYFPYDTGSDQQDRIDHAWKELRLPRPWAPSPVSASPQEQLQARFTLPQDATIRPLQESAADIARAAEQPSLIVIEAAMGEGKTEAALIAAEILAERFGLGGVYYALPTQATTNAMFERALDWIAHLDNEHDTDLTSVFLAHNKRDLNEHYDHLRYRGWSQHIGESSYQRDSDDSHRIEAIVHSWLKERKRGMLSNFVIGTIDQILMSALKSRHLMLRHLALAGKVVIIDEAHAYSTFMNVYLDTALSWLGAYGVPVIVLSATLPADRRAKMLAAYEKGTSPRPRSRAKTRVAPASVALTEVDLHYPIISVTTGPDSRTTTHPQASNRSTPLTIHALDDSDDTLKKLLTEKLVEGGCAVVIRNTVARAQRTAAFLRDQFNDVDVTLAHSRFLAVDRAQRDSQLLSWFGPDRVGVKRPATHIVVATQVVEQSLDVDFDLMISDLAPMDLLLQRAGRLHRHQRGENQDQRPMSLRTAELYVAGADWNQVPPKPDRGSARVYDAHLLLRTLAVLDSSPSRPRDIVLPHDIPSLVQAVYADDRVGPEDWQDAMTSARLGSIAARTDKENQANTFRIAPPGVSGSAITGWVAAGIGEPDEEKDAAGRKMLASVRDGDDSVEVLLLWRRGEEVIIPPWVESDGGMQVDTGFAPLDAVARSILRCSIQLNRASVGGSVDDVIGELERRNFHEFIGWQQSRLLKGQLVLVFDEDGTTKLNGQRLRYTKEDGLERIADE